MSPQLQFLAIYWYITSIFAYAQGCGRPPLVESRIVGGVDATNGAWPWQVDIQTAAEGHICGGSLISDSWVASAAHCFPNPSDVSSYIIYVGRFQLNADNPYMSSRRVVQVLIPSGYTEPQTGRDLALVQLSSPVSWSDHVHPVCLPASYISFPSGTICTVTGWGNIRQDVPLQGVGTLQEVQVPIISQSSCQRMYQQSGAQVDILSDMICAGYQEGGKDSCQGDSGGPLVCKMSNGTWVQAGVVSFGEGCANANQPGVYARLTSYSSFISSYIPEIKLYDRADQKWSERTVVLVFCLSTLLILLQT
uniref:Peptidase S1 domain-containing protein n=1 Tax=Monopterus albus TaxID=43700 RepID=A0A3Q3K311_MONAL|nr:serine protease 33-like [Monopterus albus]